ncbi:hypothetical protein WJ0W_004504 [Paenibacillus melissococcoides]|uniref:Lipoprotein n=1 Tax=Paenibacillus melissococcoides TaxID=2912268 RepID=A0ABM9G5Z1_9BACL|nr:MULTISPECIES: hypothetical protein [Paenibacillus]MEB9897720.1 hypothetical protein [Bacillus cereus]CAH8247270.1 hypothetical protein WJ0W_004504 [Paenibacillus melissococcoides]CAH8717211.1 hypothetical protein HTL2_004871 [Paenibacillus melissococcoides]CAH8718199.1 hypothetical protein WDD9_005144 [Paenibacillus melissococcoides]GIO77929.1 hypothetical protein J6TS7_15390 [Paenibacillus dendritiformis]
MGGKIGRGRRCALLSAVCGGFVILLHGCGVTANPDDMLNRALSGVGGQDQVRFEGLAEICVGEDMLLTKQFRYEGEMKQYKGVHMKLSADMDQRTTAKRWNPVAQMDQLLRMGNKQVSFLPEADARVGAKGTTGQENKAEQEGRDLVPLQVTLSNEEAKRIYINQLEEDYKRIIIPSEPYQKIRRSLSEQERNKLDAELKSIVDRSRADLDQKLKDASIAGRYVVWVERRHSLPVILEGWLTAGYNDNGKERRETVHTKTRFTYK